jgi:hypothetical protein
MEEAERRSNSKKKRERVFFSFFFFSFHLADDKTSLTTETKLSQLPFGPPPSSILLLQATRSPTVSMSASSRSVSLGASTSPQDSIEAAAAAKTCGVDQVTPWEWEKRGRWSF